MVIKLKHILSEAVQAKFEPIKLNHKFGAYAPAFDEETMKTHFNKHYKGYIDKLNEAVKEENIPKAQEALSHRALMNKLAANGAWNLDLE